MRRLATLLAVLVATAAAVTSCSSFSSDTAPSPPSATDGGGVDSGTAATDGASGADAAEDATARFCDGFPDAAYCESFDDDPYPSSGSNLAQNGGTATRVPGRSPPWALGSTITVAGSSTAVFSHTGITISDAKAIHFHAVVRADSPTYDDAESVLFELRPASGTRTGFYLVFLDGNKVDLYYGVPGTANSAPVCSGALSTGYTVASWFDVDILVKPSNGSVAATVGSVSCAPNATLPDLDAGVAVGPYGVQPLLGLDYVKSGTAQVSIDDVTFTVE
jgi:hypothetical protein